MRDLEGRLQDLELIIRQKVETEKQLATLAPSGLGAVEVANELQTQLRQAIQAHNDLFRRELLKTLEFPPRHLRHFEHLEAFWSHGGPDESVFIMSKFPEGETDGPDKQLAALLETVSQAVTSAGFVPRIANGPKSYHPGLWDNVELHLLACSRGIAIVEDRYRSELNPNVAMEWGWMRAMGKPVLYLVDGEFDHFRADVEGLLKEEFSWANPSEQVIPSVQAWLSDEA